MKQKFIVTVSIIPYKKNGRLLVTERSAREKQGSGLLSYCGGKIDNLNVSSIEEVEHSILQKTATCELLEEAGVEIYDDTMFLINNHAFQRFDDDLCLMIVFIAKFKSQRDIKLDKNEIASIQWLLFNEIDNKKMYDSVYRVYKEANEYLRNNKLIKQR